jgi:HEPN domain-containing protein
MPCIVLVEREFKGLGRWAIVSFEEAEVIRERAEAFLRNAKNLLREGEYDLAAFNIEQYCQLMLKYKLLIRTGTYPRTHSLVRLIRELAKVMGNAERLLEDMVMVTKIEDAYIGSRYLPRRYERVEVEAMLKYVEEKFKPIVNGL